jgi:hypothetical protein
MHRVRSELFAVGALVVVVVVVLAAALVVRFLTESHATSIENGRPVEVSAARLQSFAQNREVYWAGPALSKHLELTKTGRSVFVRYLPKNVHAGDPRALFTTVGTYAAQRGYEEAIRAHGRAGMVTRRAPDRQLAVWSRFRPTSVYLAKQGSSTLVEVFDPRAERARALALSGKIQQVRGSADSAADTGVKRSLLRGVAEIRGSQNGKSLRGRLVRTLASLRRERGSTTAGRKGRKLAIQGFTWTLKGIDSQLAMLRNDSGRLEGAVRDAKKADRYLNRGATLLRAAGRTFDVRIGILNGH